MNKEVRKLVQSITQVDGVDVRNGGKHLTVFYDDRFVTTIGKTPSDHRWRENTLADLRRAGITPKVVPVATEPKVADLIPIPELRTRLKAMPSMAAFGRFVYETSQTAAIPGYRNVESAQTALGIFRRGDGSLSEKNHVLVDQALRQWDKVESAKHRAEIVQTIASGATDIPVELLVPESVSNGTVEAAAVTLRVDVGKLTETLARFGITLVVE